MKRLLTGALIATVAVTLIAGPAGAKTKPRPKTPPACLAALDAADDMNATTVTVLEAFGVYFAGIGAAASAASGSGILGGLNYINAQTPLLTTLVDTIKTQTPVATEARIRYDASALVCRG
jgi:hypothetical protein